MWSSELKTSNIIGLLGRSIVKTKNKQQLCNKWRPTTWPNTLTFSHLWCTSKAITSSWFVFVVLPSFVRIYQLELTAVCSVSSFSFSFLSFLFSHFVFRFEPSKKKYTVLLSDRRDQWPLSLRFVCRFFFFSCSSSSPSLFWLLMMIGIVRHGRRRYWQRSHSFFFNIEWMLNGRSLFVSRGYRLHLCLSRSTSPGEWADNWK